MTNCGLEEPGGAMALARTAKLCSVFQVAARSALAKSSALCFSMALGCAAFAAGALLVSDTAQAQATCTGDLNTAATDLRTVYDVSTGMCVVTEFGNNSSGNGDLTFQFAGSQVAGIRGVGAGNTGSGLARCDLGNGNDLGSGGCFTILSNLVQNTPQTTVLDWDSSGAAIPGGTADLRMLVTYVFDGTNMTISSGSVVSIATAAPEIEISGNGVEILSRTDAAQLSDHSQFENTDVGSTSTRTYTIRNLGSANLTVGASLQSGVIFSITGAPTSPVAPGGSTTVTVQFAPTFETTHVDNLIITSNDGNEGTTQFPIAGTGTNGTPNFEVREAGGNPALTIAHNDMAPRVADGTDFGGVDVTAGTESNSFNVQPAGSSAPALFTGTPSRVQISGTHAGDFSVTQDLPASQSGGAALFTIQFDPSGPGLRQATVEIPSNVTGKNPYTFAIQGTGTGVATGDVTFEVSIGGGDATLNLASPTTALAVAITTVNGQATRNIANVASGTHTVTLPDLTMLGFGWTSISCADGDSTVDLAALTMTLELGVGESLVCTLQLVETRLATSRMIADFLGARNTQILNNQPGFTRRWQRLNGGQGGASSLTTSLLGFSHRFDFPFQAALSEGEASFAASLSGFSGGDLAGSDIGSWDVWSEGRISRFDDSSSDNGLFAIVHGGVDYRMGQDVLVGVAVSVDWTSQDNATNAGHISGTGWMAGPYALIRLDESVYVDARASWGQSSNTISPLGTYTDTFDTTRWLVAGAISGDYRHGGWTLNPVVSLQYIEERQEAYVDSLSVTIPGQTVAQGDVRFEPRLAYSWQTLGGTQVTPWMQLAGVYTFGQRGTFSSGSLVSRMSGLSSTVRTGLDIAMPGGAGLSLSAQVSGIGAGAQSHGGSLAVSLPLN